MALLYIGAVEVYMQALPASSALWGIGWRLGDVAYPQSMGICKRKLSIRIEVNWGQFWWLDTCPTTSRRQANRIIGQPNNQKYNQIINIHPTSHKILYLDCRWTQRSLSWNSRRCIWKHQSLNNAWLKISVLRLLLREYGIDHFRKLNYLYNIIIGWYAAFIPLWQSAKFKLSFAKVKQNKHPNYSLSRLFCLFGFCLALCRASNFRFWHWHCWRYSEKTIKLLAYFPWCQNWRALDESPI